MATSIRPGKCVSITNNDVRRTQSSISAAFEHQITADTESITSEKENKSRSGEVPVPNEQPTALKNANFSISSIDEDLAELAAIERDLDQQQQHLAPTPKKTNVPKEKTFEMALSMEPKR